MQQPSNGAPAAAEVRLRLLHSPCLILPDGAAHPLRRNDAAVLALLALMGPTSRSRIASLVWPGATVEGARNNLRQRLFRFRRIAVSEVVIQGETLALAPWVRHELEDPARALEADPDALEGALLGNFSYDDGEEIAQWVATAREQWRATLREALAAIATRLDAEGRIAQALRYATRLVREEPLLEHGSRLLMRLHYRRGDRGAALAEFERCVTTLHTQLGEPPSSETVELAQWIGQAQEAPTSAPAPVPLALRHPPRMVGRAAVVAAAERCWSDHGVVLLTGAAGVGKTRVFAELVSRWRIEVVVQAHAEDALQSHALLGRLAGALLRHVDAARCGADEPLLRWLADPLERPRPAARIEVGQVARAMQQLLRAAGEAQVGAVAIDDLHFADAASLQVLCRLLPPLDGRSAPAEATLRWLLVSRDAELPAALDAWLAAAADHADPQVQVPPLDAPGTTELLLSLHTPGLDVPAWSERLYAHCGGHPLYLLHVLRELHDAGSLTAAAPPRELPVPAETSTMVARRIARLDPLAQQLAYVAALCGADFSATMAARLLERPPARLLVPWRRLEDMDILRGNQFSHDLVRQAVLAAVPRSLAPLLHRDIAQALAGAAPDRRAAHWELAERPAEAAADFSAAAFAAEAMGLQSSACELWRAAARNHRAAQCEDAAFRCEWRIGRLLLACASAAEAMQVARRLEQSARHAGERAMALELRSQIRSEQHDVGALDDAQAALALAVESGDGQLAALCRLRIASAWTVRSDYPAALDAIESVQRDAALLDADALVDLASLRVSVLAQLGRRAEAIAVNQHALDQALSSGSLAHAANFAGNAAIQLCYLGRLAEAAAGFERAVALGHRAGVERGFILVDEMGLAGVLADAGRLGEALALGERVAGELQLAGYDGWAVNAHNDCADIFLRLGRFDLAQHILGAEPASAPTWARAARRVALARLAQWRGRDPLPLVREAAELLHQGGALGHPYVKQKIELELARWTAAPQAAEQAARVIEWAAGHQHVSLGWYAGMVRIEALSMLGDTAAAARDAAALAAAFEGDWRAYGFYLPELWCVLCEAWAAAGAASPLQATLRYARRWIEERAARDVPELFRASFLEHNRFNRRLLDWPARAEITPR